MVNKMSAYGIDVGTPAIALVLLANFVTATKHKYGREFRLVMQSIQTTYAYNYKHNGASLKVILTELAKADSVRTLKDAPPPGTATANLVADTTKQLKTMTGDVLREQYNKDDTVADYDTESAYGTTTDDSSMSKDDTDGLIVVTGKKCNSNKITVTKENITALHNAYAILSVSNDPTIESNDKEHIIVHLTKLAKAVESTKQKRQQQ